MNKKAKKNRKAQVNIQLEPAVHEALKRQASKDSRTQTNYALTAVLDKLRAQGEAV